MQHKPVLALLGLSLLLGAPALAQTEAQSDTQAGAAADSATPVAVVNGEAIPQALYQVYVGQRRPQLANLSDEQAAQAMKDELVVQELLVQEAEKRNLADDPQVQAQLDLMRRNMLAAITLRQAMAGQQPSEEAIQQEYENAVGGMNNAEYQARHILVDSQEKAQDLIGELEGGADFAELAKEHSSDTSAESGGDLGWFSPDMMVPPFAEAVQNLEKGQYTQEPVQTPFGWHVILLEDSRTQEAPPLDQVRDQILQRLQGQMLRQYLEGLRQQAEVEVN